jgi:hypothetical protein
MLNALRLNEGFGLSAFSERTGPPCRPSSPAWRRPRRAACSSAMASGYGQARVVLTF